MKCAVLVTNVARIPALNDIVTSSAKSSFYSWLSYGLSARLLTEPMPVTNSTLYNRHYPPCRPKKSLKGIL
jgi:hypothetical protein